jgi:hypothetical protein
LVTFLAELLLEAAVIGLLRSERGGTRILGVLMHGVDVPGSIAADHSSR